MCICVWMDRGKDTKKNYKLGSSLWTFCSDYSVGVQTSLGWEWETIFKLKCLLVYPSVRAVQ